MHSRFLLPGLLLLTMLNVLGTGLLNLSLSRTQPSGWYRTANHGITIANSDDEYYLGPVDNYLAGKGWRRNPPLGNGSYYRRTPGYSILYFMAAKVTGNHQTGKFYVLVGVQVLLMLLSVTAVWYSIPWLTPSHWARIGVTLLFTVLPFVSSYAFMTVTESLYPHFLLWYLYWLFRAYYHPNYSANKRTGAFVLAALFLTFSILTRPVTGILGLALAYLVLRWLWTSYAGFVASSRILVTIAITPSLLIGAWTLRNYVLTGDIVPLEVAFHPQSHDRMKPEFKGLFTFVKSWGEDGATMNSWQLPLYKAAMAGDTSATLADAVINHFPPRVIESLGRPRLRQVLHQYQLTVYSQKPYFDQQLPLPTQYTPLELNTQSRFDSLTQAYSKRYPLSYYIGVPLIYLQRAVFNSGTSNSYIFQEPFRNHKILVVIRFVFLLTHIIAYANILFNSWSLRHDSSRWVVFCAVPLLYLIFFVVYFQEIEQRYLLPALLLALLGMYRPLSLLEQRFKQTTSPSLPV